MFFWGGRASARAEGQGEGKGEGEEKAEGKVDRLFNGVQRGGGYHVLN